MDPETAKMERGLIGDSDLEFFWPDWHGGCLLRMKTDGKKIPSRPALFLYLSTCFRIYEKYGNGTEGGKRCIPFVFVGSCFYQDDPILVPYL
jgi:hypothetical protein